MGDAVEAIAHARQTVDQDLVERAGLGDHDAFAALVESRLDHACRTASAILGSDADARDVVQDMFLAAWMNLPRLRDASRFDAWLGRILVNRCRDALRRRHRSREISFDDGVLTDGTDPDLEMTVLEAAFERLPLSQRQLLVLHHLHHEPVAEIARELRVPLGTAKWRLHAARRALEQALEAER